MQKATLKEKVQRALTAPQGQSADKVVDVPQTHKIVKREPLIRREEIATVPKVEAQAPPRQHCLRAPAHVARILADLTRIRGLEAELASQRDAEIEEVELAACQRGELEDPQVDLADLEIQKSEAAFEVRPVQAKCILFWPASFGKLMGPH